MVNKLYQLYNWSKASEMNPKLYRIIEDAFSHQVNGGGRSTKIRFFVRNRKIPEINQFLNWIEKITALVSHTFSVEYDDEGNRRYNYSDKEYLLDLDQGGNANIDELGAGGEMGFNPYAFKICDAWGLLYKKGEGVTRHNHFPYTLAFVYYVNTPEGSAPVILNGEEIRPTAGQVLFFQGHHYHSVPPSDVDDRCVIAGLITYAPNFPKPQIKLSTF